MYLAENHKNTYFSGHLESIKSKRNIGCTYFVNGGLHDIAIFLLL